MLHCANGVRDCYRIVKVSISFCRIKDQYLPEISLAPLCALSRRTLPVRVLQSGDLNQQVQPLSAPLSPRVRHGSPSSTHSVNRWHTCGGRGARLRMLLGLAGARCCVSAADSTFVPDANSIAGLAADFSHLAYLSTPVNRSFHLTFGPSYRSCLS